MDIPSAGAPVDQRHYNEAMREIERLQRERDEWKEWHASMQALRDKHSKSVDRLIAERDRLQREADRLNAGWNLAEQESFRRKEMCDRLRAEFKNFHRLLCERFGYGHDEVDWKRDQLSLIEHIAREALGPAQESMSHG